MSFWTELLGAEIRYTGKKYRTRIIEFGQGKPLILLHGNGGHAENYIKNIPCFAKHFRTIAIDLLWHGYSSKPEFNPALIPSFIDQINDLMDAESIGSAYFEGQSMGAWPAMEMALSHSKRVEKLVLTTAQGFRLNVQDPQSRKDFQSNLLEKTLQALKNPDLPNMKIRLERLVVDKELITDELVQVRHTMYNDPETNAFQIRFANAYLGGEESRKHLISEERLGQIACPTLVYWSENNSVPPAVGERLAKAIPGARYHCVKNTGHWAQYEHAEEHNNIVTEFLNG